MNAFHRSSAYTRFNNNNNNNIIFNNNNNNNNNNIYVTGNLAYKLNWGHKKNNTELKCLRL